MAITMRPYDTTPTAVLQASAEHVQQPGLANVDTSHVLAYLVRPPAASAWESATFRSSPTRCPGEVPTTGALPTRPAGSPQAITQASDPAAAAAAMGAYYPRATECPLATLTAYGPQGCER